MEHVDASGSSVLAPSALSAWMDRQGAGEVLSRALGAFGAEAWFAVDEERRIVHWSPGAEALLGFSREEVEGEHCLKANRCLQCMRGCGIADFGDVKDVPLRMMTAAGREVPVVKTARAFFRADGSFAGGIEVLRRDPRPDAASPRKARALPVAPEALAKRPAFHGILTEDERMEEALEIVRNVAQNDVTVLVRGESGTGKELVARAIHLESRRKKGPFVAINCAALSPTLLESELFGHERGAFSGAVARHHGVFEQAEGGTLFLDEVAELPLDLQAKLLRAVQEKAFQRVGGQKTITVDVRIVSATHRSLRARVAEGTFREDLMYRLRVVPIFLPPLRERRVDIRLLALAIVEDLSRERQRVVTSVAPEAMRALMDYAWPGNVRELRNALEYAFAVGRGPVLTADQLPPELRGGRTVDDGGLRIGAPPPPPPPPPPPKRRAAPASSEDEEAIQRALDLHRGDLAAAAASLGMSRTTFWRRRQKLGLTDETEPAAHGPRQR